ncbi:response regulator [bacterium]|nr:response regulator [bacterium]
MTVSRNILIVDDEEDIAWGISKNLAKTGLNLEIECVETADEALAELNQKKFDLVVSDIRLPGRDGLELITDVRNKHPETKVIIMTAYGSPRTRQQVEDLGGFFYIEKPFNVGYLKQIVFEALELDGNGFSGYIENVRIRELVEYNCLHKRSLTLTLKKHSECGNIYFKNGNIVHAECGILEGEEAFYDILKWGEGTFETTPGSVKNHRTIVRDWKALLHQCA